MICSTSNESQTGLGQRLVIPKRTVDSVFLEFDPGNSPPALLVCIRRSVVGSTNVPFSEQFKSVSKVDVLSSKHPSSLPGPQQHFPQDVCATLCAAGAAATGLFIYPELPVTEYFRENGTSCEAINLRMAGAAAAASQHI